MFYTIQLSWSPLLSSTTTTMFPSVSNNCDFQKEYHSNSPTPSAPPCPRPPPPTPLLSSNFQERTGIPFHATNYSKMSGPTPDQPVTKADTNHTTHKDFPVQWSTGLCDCCSDVNNCCLTCWCPCITFGRIAEMVDRGSTSCGVSGALYTLIMCLTGCSCLYSCFYRSKLRGQFFLEESPCTDCCVHCCCEGCALCQEYRELKNRGFDMSIGWHGNVERQKRLAAVAPAIEGGMTR